MTSPSFSSPGAKDGLRDIGALQFIPLPLLVLSTQRTVVLASDAFARLISWSPRSIGPSTHLSAASLLAGCSLKQLDIQILPDQNGNVSDLDEALRNLAHRNDDKHHTDGQSVRRHENESRREGLTGRPDSVDGDYDFWPEDDWSGCPSIALDVRIQRAAPKGRSINARMSVKYWSNAGTASYVLTFARPTLPQRTLNDRPASEASIQVNKKAQKLAMVLRMKNAVFDNAHIPSFLFSADETMYYPNHAGRHLTGQLEDDYMLEHGYQILARLDCYDEKYEKKLPVDDIPGIKMIRTRTNFRETKLGFYDYQTGKRVRLDLSGDCLYDNVTGEFLGGIVWCRDVTDYTEVIAQQQSQIQRGFEDNLDFMPNLSFTSAPNGFADYFSKRWYDYTGTQKKEHDSGIWKHSIHPDDEEKTWAYWIQCVEQGKDFEMEARYRRYDGIYRWHLVRGVSQRNDDGQIVRWHGALADIHDLVMKRIEASHRKEQMITVLSHAEVNLFGFDRNMGVTMLEGSMKWGSTHNPVEKKDLLGDGLDDVLEQTTSVGTSGAADFVNAVQKIVNGKSTMEVLEHEVDGKWYRSRIIADLSSDSASDTDRGALGLSIDITDLKARTALEIEKTQLVANEISAKESNQLKTQFLANVSHELRTPIAGVLGMADLLAETPLVAEQREFARGIQQSADSLLGIVNDILDASKIEAGRFDIEAVQFDLSAVLNDLVKLMAYAAQKKGLTLDFTTSLQSTEQVIGDPGRTRQILVNLLTNAIKFTSKGKITFSVRHVEIEGVLEIVFVVEDTGIGIADSVLRKLFRPFSQGDSSTARLYGGTGLGLTICRELATLMNGRIGLESRPNFGSKATFALPFKRALTRAISRDEPTQMSAMQLSESQNRPNLDDRPLRRMSPGIEDITAVNGLRADLSPAERSKIQVLVVEDNAINQAIALKVVRKLGFPVRAVWNGQEALEYLMHPTVETPRPSIILMDCQMPVKDGYAATRELRSSTDVRLGSVVRQTPVVALTASAILGDREKCEDAGMDDYITKPVTKRDLERVLVKWALRSQAAGR